jgi:uncharacterized protein YfaQ (DUF2300 family)
VRLVGLISVLTLVACGPAQTAQEQSAATAERFALADKFRTASVAEWKSATTPQRIAAADTMTIAVLMHNGIPRPTDAQIDPRSHELRTCLDEATRAQGMDGAQPLKDFTTQCLLSIDFPAPR